ncbi:MAG: hypothetical protein HZA54_17400 [Planctomycetes bacterium]|nr:hypothetical protein [Planctomycetota bacterium]
MLTALIETFGPMPGAYDGPYPSAEEAYTRVRASDRWASLGVWGEHPPLRDDVEVPLPGEALAGLRRFLACDRVRWALVEDRCLLVAQAEAGHAQRVALLDVRTGEWLERLSITPFQVELLDWFAEARARSEGRPVRMPLDPRLQAPAASAVQAHGPR